MAQECRRGGRGDEVRGDRHPARRSAIRKFTFLEGREDQSQLLTVKKLVIPRRFDLGGHRITVKMIDDTEHDKAGSWDNEENIIRLWSKGRSHDYMVQTFLHELSHAILDTWSLPKHSTNEKLVDALGQGLMQYMKTVTY